MQMSEPLTKTNKRTKQEKQESSNKHKKTTCTQNERGKIMLYKGDYSCIAGHKLAGLLSRETETPNFASYEFKRAEIISPAL